MDTVYALRDEVQELKQVSPHATCKCLFILSVAMLFKFKIWCRDPDSLILHHQDNKRMKRTLEEEQKARKELEKIVRKVLKNMNDSSWDETNL